MGLLLELAEEIKRLLLCCSQALPNTCKTKLALEELLRNVCWLIIVIDFEKFLKFTTQLNVPPKTFN
jgi:hypothetical protein